MNTYESNYWGLYFEFLDVFRELTHEGFPLALCIHFHGFIHKNKRMEGVLLSPKSQQWIKQPVKQPALLQPRFDTFLSPFHLPPHVNGNGKIVFYDKLMRIPKTLFPYVSPPSRTIILKQDVKNMGGALNKGDISVMGLNQYEVDISQSFQRNRKRLQKIRSRMKKHPLFGQQDFQIRMKKEMLKAIRFMEASNRFMEQVKVSTLLMGETNSSDARALVLTARMKGIPTICLQHGVITSPFGYLPKVASYQAVYGKYEKEFYQSRGVEPSGIPIIGHPRFDEIISRNPIRAAAFKRNVGVKNRTPKVLFIAHHTDHQILTELIRMLLQKSNTVEVVVKVRKSTQALEHLAKEERVHLVKRMHLYDLFDHTDMVVSYKSTVVLEALLARKPIFIWNFNEVGLTDYFEKLPVRVYNDYEKLINEVLVQISSRSPQPPHTDQIRKSFYIDGKELAAQKLKNLINDLNT